VHQDLGLRSCVKQDGLFRSFDQAGKSPIRLCPFLMEILDNLNI
jgi:hypothetical protein